MMVARRKPRKQVKIADLAESQLSLSDVLEEMAADIERTYLAYGS